MVPGRTSFVYAPVQLSRWLSAVVTIRKFSTTVTRCYTAAQAVGPASEPKSVHVGYVVDTEALWRFVRVAWHFPVSVISPVLHTHSFRLSPMLFGFCVKRHEIKTLKVTWPLIGFSSSVSCHYRLCTVVSSCAHFSSFSNKVSISSPSELRLQLIFILSTSAVLDARRGICVCVCVLRSCALYENERFM